MKQTRKASLLESISNVLVGYGINLIAQILVFAGLGIRVSLAENIQIGLVFTVISIVRSFAMRRAFEVLRVRGVLPVLIFVVAGQIIANPGQAPTTCDDGWLLAWLCKHEPTPLPPNISSDLGRTKPEPRPPVKEQLHQRSN